MPARKPSDMVGLKLRFREDLRRQIEKSAKRRNVSLNNEIVRRLEQSFDAERHPPSERLSQALLLASRSNPKMKDDPIVKKVIEEIEEAFVQPEIMDYVFHDK